MGTVALEIYLGVQMFVLGVLSVIGVRYGRTHLGWFGGVKRTQPPAEPPAAVDKLAGDLERDLLEKSEDRFRSVLDHNASKLHQDLENSADHINRMVNQLGLEIVGREMERYQQDFARLRHYTQNELEGAHAEVSKHEAEIKARIEAELQAEKQKLIEQINTKLGDAVASFLSETLQHNVDLGNQSQYLLQMLEEHKQDFVKEIGQKDETETAG